MISPILEPDTAINTGEDNTIIVQLDDGWHIFVPVAESDGSNRNMGGLSEQEKMEIDPYYNAD